ncbi:MAG: biotin--[acetyl-CoA-carboxylase] ligase [Alphaproteobacteria bacterium]
MRVPPNYTIIHYENIDSTNAAAKRFALYAEFDKVLITAKKQTDGKGRHGKTWVSFDGNFYASFILPAKKYGGEKLLSLPFLTSLALQDALIEAGTSKKKIALKWPNDVLVNKKKIAGILIETDSTQDRIVVGIGVNLKAHPDDTAYGATHLAKEIKKTIDSKEFLGILIPHFEKWLSLCGDDERASIMTAWQENAFHLGKKIKVKTASESLAGKFLGLDTNGSLLLKNDLGAEIKISAGEIIV